MLHLPSKRRKIGCLLYRHFYIASCGEDVCCITDIFSLQAVEKKWAALPVFLPSKQWRRSELHYRYFYAVSSGKEVSCITDNFLRSKQWKRRELHYRYFYPVSSGKEESCITYIFTQQAVEKKRAALPIFLHNKQWKRRELPACKESNLKTFRSVKEHVTDSSTWQTVQRHCKLLPSRRFTMSYWFPLPTFSQHSWATGRLNPQSIFVCCTDRHRLCVSSHIVISCGKMSGLLGDEVDRLRDGLTDWQTDRLTDWQTHWQTDWLTDWHTDRQTDWLTDRQTDWLTERLTDRLSDRQTDR